MTQHPEAAALMAAIRRNKGDDLPRLVYADWLEAHGQDLRAEYIRLGIEFAKYGPGVPGELRRKLQDMQHRANILPADREKRIDFSGVFMFSGTTVENWINIDGYDYEIRSPRFDRGFVHAITGSHDWFVANAAAIFRENPVERVYLTDQPHVRELAVWNNDTPFRLDPPEGPPVFGRTYSLVDFGEALAEGRIEQPRPRIDYRPRLFTGEPTDYNYASA